MFKDQIVEESRNAGYMLAEAAGYDPKKFIELLRKKERSAKRTIVPPPLKRLRRSAGRNHPVALKV